VSDDSIQQLDAFLTPGALLKAAREARDLSQREVADQLHLMPGYPAVIERDDFKALRHPAFARGYVKAYGKLVGVDEKRLLEAYDRLRAQEEAPAPKAVRARPVQLQHTGLGVIVGLFLLVLLVAAIWWWQAEPQEPVQDSAFPADTGVVGGIARDDSISGER
jgi:cytoskeletal protein RodZ